MEEVSQFYITEHKTSDVSQHLAVYRRSIQFGPPADAPAFKLMCELKARERGLSRIQGTNVDEMMNNVKDLTSAVEHLSTLVKSASGGVEHLSKIVLDRFPKGSVYNDLAYKLERPFGQRLSKLTSELEKLNLAVDKLHRLVNKSGGKKQLLSIKAAEVEDIVESRAAAPLPNDHFSLTLEEKLNVVLGRDGGVVSFDMQGALSLHILNQEDGCVQVQFETGAQFSEMNVRTRPNINRVISNNEIILVMKKPGPLPTGVDLLRYVCPINANLLSDAVNCWPSVKGNKTYVSLEYEASHMFDLNNVIISVPLPFHVPSVTQCDGVSSYDPRKSILKWSISVIDNSNRSGSMEFVVPPAESSAFFPICVLAATSTYSGLKVTGMIPCGGGGTTPELVERTQLVTGNYQVL